MSHTVCSDRHCFSSLLPSHSLDFHDSFSERKRDIPSLLFFIPPPALPPFGLLLPRTNLPHFILQEQIFLCFTYTMHPILLFPSPPAFSSSSSCDSSSFLSLTIFFSPSSFSSPSSFVRYRRTSSSLCPLGFW